MKKYSMYVNTEELKKARNKKQKTYEDMAQEMGMKSPVSYYNIEVGIVEPKISQMIKISQILNKPIGKIFNLRLQEDWIDKEGKSKWITYKLMKN